MKKREKLYSLYSLRNFGTTILYGLFDQQPIIVVSVRLFLTEIPQFRLHRKIQAQLHDNDSVSATVFDCE
jgi:hypothetical protein